MIENNTKHSLIIVFINVWSDKFCSVSMSDKTLKYFDSTGFDSSFHKNLEEPSLEFL